MHDRSSSKGLDREHSQLPRTHLPCEGCGSKSPQNDKRWEGEGLAKALCFKSVILLSQCHELEP